MSEAKILPLKGVPRGEREVINVGGELHVQCNAGVRSLGNDPGLYHRDGYLAHVVRLGPDEATPEKPRGTPEIRRLTAAALAARMSAVARWVKLDRRNEPPTERPAFPPAAVARAIADFGQWPQLRRLEGVVEMPVLRPNGTVIEERGWDRATGLLYDPSEEYPAVPKKPSRDDARKALTDLREPFIDFPYAREEQRDVPVAAILTLLARPAILGSVPAFLFDASDRGAGKSLQVQVISRIATGRWSRPRTFPAKEGRVNEDELSKILGAIAIAGRPLVDFDNVRCTVDGAPLLAALTTIEEQEFRVLGESRDALMVWRAVVCIGGNNLAIGDEMSRRCLLARAEPPEERHELRADLPREKGGYLHPRLRSWVAKERPRLAVAGLVLLRAWYAAGCPRQEVATKASFEEWSDIIPHALMWAGAADVTLCRPDTSDADEDPLKGALRTVLASWPRLQGADGVTASQVVRTLYPGGKRPQPSDGPPDGFEDLRDAIETLTEHRVPGRAPGASALGYKLKAFKGTKLAGKCLVTAGVSGGSARWKIGSGSASQGG